jgi:hypothetical protein
MACSGSYGRIILVFSLEVVGRDTVSMLVPCACLPVIYIICAEGGASSRYRFLSMLNLGAADSRSLIMMVAVKCGRVSARISQWPGRCATPPAQARGLSSADPKLWVRWKYVRRRCSSGLG